MTKWEGCVCCVSHFSAGKVSWVFMISHRHALKMLHKVARVNLSEDAKGYCRTVALILKPGMGCKVVSKELCASVTRC